jgi:hypothetical protein
MTLSSSSSTPTSVVLGLTVRSFPRTCTGTVTGGCTIRRWSATTSHQNAPVLLTSLVRSSTHRHVGLWWVPPSQHTSFSLVVS